MFDTKLIHLFSSFSAEERRRLRKWMASDFVNKNKDILSFFDFIDSRSSISEKTVTKEKAHAYIYGKKSFSDLRIRHLIWMTTEILEDFIAYNSLKNYPSLKEYMLTQHYSENEMYKYSNQCIEDGMEVLQKSTLRNAAFHLDQYRLYNQYYHVNSHNNRSKDFKLQEVIDHLSLFAVTETLKYACIIQSLERISELKIVNHLLPSVLSLIENSSIHTTAVVRIYYNMYLLISEDKESVFDELIRDLHQSKTSFSKQELKELYLLAINYCVKKSNQNIQSYTQKAFDLYLYAIREHYLLESNKISRFSLTNVVTLGIKLREFSRAEQFVKDFAPLVAAEYRKNTIDFNTAKILYAQGEHKKALKILLTNEFQDTIWNLNAKSLVLKILFDTKELELFDAHLKAFNMYIRRKSNVGYHQQYFSNVQKAFTQLLNVYKKPEKYKGFTFGNDTPDVDWFNKALKEI